MKWMQTRAQNSGHCRHGNIPLTRRLVLSPATGDDLDAIWHIWRQPDVRRYLFDDVPVTREDREGRTARTAFRANRDIVASGEHLRDLCSSNFGRTLSGYVKVVWPGLRLADHIPYIHR
jgi:hypothetical protein